MIDPMANLDAAPGPGGAGETGAGGEGQDAFDVQAYRFNMRKADKIRSFMGIVSGCVAGICGLTGLAGLACFIVMHLTVSLAILAKMDFDLKAYSRGSMLAFLTADLQKCAMSFMLFWTLFFGMVYLF